MPSRSWCCVLNDNGFGFIKWEQQAKGFGSFGAGYGQSRFREVRGELRRDRHEGEQGRRPVRSARPRPLRRRSSCSSSAPSTIHRTTKPSPGSWPASPASSDRVSLSTDDADMPLLCRFRPPLSLSPGRLSSLYCLSCLVTQRPVASPSHSRRVRRDEHQGTV